MTLTLPEDTPGGPITFNLTGQTGKGVECPADAATVILPNDYDTVEIMYKTFIACEVAGPTIWDPTLYDFFAGDNRGFSYSASLNQSRTYQLTSLTVDPGNPTGQVGNGPLQRKGITRGYDDEPDSTDVTPLATPTCGGQCSHTFLPGASAECTMQDPDPGGDGQLQMVFTRIDASSVNLDVTINAGDQCEFAVPNIDVTLRIEFRQECENGVLKPLEFRASGSYNGYPWHELYLNGVPVFKHDPCVTGEGPFSMVGSGEHHFDGTGQLPEVNPSQTGTNLAIWQPVP